MYKNKYIIFLSVLFLIVLSLVFKLLIAWLGHNSDMESWMTVSGIMQYKKVVYSNTHLYNYGPLWSYILWFLGGIATEFEVFKIREFHLIVAYVLGVTDILISFVIYKIYGKYPALIYLFNPASILLTGYHSQIENIAVLLALSSWYFYLEAQKRADNRKQLTISSILFGLSLSAKHILVFFPLWVFLIKDYKFIGLRKKLYYFLFSYFVFFSGFVIEYFRAQDQGATVITGIKANVLGYKGSYGFSFITHTINLFFPSKYIDDYFQFVPIFKGYIFFYLIIIAIFGYTYIRKRNAEVKNILPMYLLVFFAFSVSMADQYIGIALPAVSIFYSNPIAIFFFIIVFTYLSAGASANIRNLQTYAMNLNIFGVILPFVPWNTIRFVEGISTQAWAAVLSVYLLFNTQNISIKFRKYFKIIVCTFAICLLQLTLYIFIKYSPPKESKIEVNTASYGLNCGGKKGNATAAVAGECNNKSECTYTVTMPDHKVGCAKWFRVEWNCEPGNKIKSEYFINYEGETSNTKVILKCPAELYSR